MASTLAQLVLGNMKAADLSGGRPGVIPAIDRVLTLSTRGDDRRDKKFHPSDLSKDFCPLAWALYQDHPDGLAAKAAAHSPQTKRIFGNGHGVHSRIQQYLRDSLFGTWTRVVGLNPTTDQPIIERRTSTFCPGPHWTYAEVGLSHAGDNIAGHTDGVLLLDGEKAVLEVKSIFPEGFKWLSAAPHVAHQIQVDIYLHCLEAERQTLPHAWVGEDADMVFAARPIDGVWVLYECKGTQQLKQFYIPADMDRVRRTLNVLADRMAAGRRYLTTGELPRCGCPEKKRNPLCTKLRALPPTITVPSVWDDL